MCVNIRCPAEQGLIYKFPLLLHLHVSAGRAPSV